MLPCEGRKPSGSGHAELPQLQVSLRSERKTNLSPLTFENKIVLNYLSVVSRGAIDDHEVCNIFPLPSFFLNYRLKGDWNPSRPRF